MAVEPYIEIDGGYARCPKCWTEIFPNQNCPDCGQEIDWSWFTRGDSKDKEGNK